MDENKIAEEAASSPERKKPSLMANLYDWFEVLCVAAVIVVLIFTFVGRMATVNGSSMSDTLLSGDRLIVTNLFYTPQRYDIVVVQKKDGYYSDELLVKRIIAKGGETITFDFDNWTVTVDGITLYEPYVKRIFGSMEREDIDGYTVTVPEGCYFVMGDNRNRSLDSRDSSIGMVDQRYILGKAVFRLFPFQKIGLIE